MNGMSIDNATKMSILYDYYGKLLTEKQNKIFRLYHDDNLSLSEIGQELGVSKQGVHDALKKAEAALTEFENKLGLINTSINNEKTVSKVVELLNSDSGFNPKNIEKELLKLSI